MPNKTNVTVYDRVYLKAGKKDLALEYLDGYDASGNMLDEWRIIDLATGEVFESDVGLHEVIGVASEMTTEARGENSDNWQYIEGKPPVSTYKTWDQLPVGVRLRYIQSHALDLEHDFRVVKDNRDPIEVAMQELSELYNEKPCFYLNKRTGKWDIDTEI